VNDRLGRRSVLKGLAFGALTALLGCDRVGRSPSFREWVLASGERLAYRLHRLIGSNSLAREYEPSQLSPIFRANGNTTARSADYQAHVSEGFSNWRLKVDGLVKRPGDFSLAQLRAYPARTQITRHDCVEGWSAIGQWTGVPLATLLEEVELRDEARYIVFHCADDFRGRPYYESIDLIDAFHPQTLLAYGMNGGDLPTAHGAPIRLRVERQLGYKHAKFVMRIEAVASLSEIGRGRGGYWEDVGFYDWYAGI